MSLDREPLLGTGTGPLSLPRTAPGGGPGTAHVFSTATVSMLAVGGTIGTGLFFSVATLVAHGPLTALFATGYMAFLVVIVLELTAELAVFKPATGSLCAFQFAFLGPALGWANSIIYWLSWGLTFALELSILAAVAETSVGPIPKTQFMFGAWVLLTAFNLLPVDTYGQIEFWIASVKVVALGAWIVTVAVTLVSRQNVFYVWIQDWPHSFTGPAASASELATGAAGCLIFLSFIFQSVESLAITTGDLSTPHVTIPKVTRIIFVRIVVSSVASVFLLTVLIPYSDPQLHDPQVNDALSSPFLIALLNCGFSASGGLLLAFNFVIFSAILSAANSNVYFGSRYLEAMVSTLKRSNPLSVFGRTNSNNVPVHAVLLTASFGLVALLLRYKSISEVFGFLLTCCALAGMLMWLLLCLSHMRFRDAMVQQGVSTDTLRYRSAWNLPFWSRFAAANFVVVLALNGVENVWEFSWTAFCGSYMTPAVFCVLWAGLEWRLGTGLLALDKIDLTHNATDA